MTTSNFDRIGLPYALIEDGFDYADMPDLNVSPIDGIVGTYTVMEGKTGEALWMSNDARQDPVTLNPMFTKGTLFTANLDRIHAGAPPYAYAEADADFSILEDGEIATRAQVLVVNLASIQVNETKGFLGRKTYTDAPFEAMTGKTVQLRLAVFAGRVAHFTDDASYVASQDQGHPYGCPSFFPLGMFPDDEGRTAPTGFGAGHVKSCGTASSSFNGADFHWAVVEAIGGDLGVVWTAEDGCFAQAGQVLSYEGMIIGQWENVLD